MLEKLLRFLEIDAEAQACAAALSQLLAPHFDKAIEDFYASVETFDISSYITAATVAELKPRQKQHWLALFHSRFDDKFFESVRRIGVRHRDIELNPMWYVAGYTRLKLAFTEVIIRADLPIVTKGQMVKTLDKYIAVDMALAMSTYDAVIVD